MERGKKMKSKFSYKSKRTIIIAAIITVLLAGTATGVYFFTKGNAQAQAAGDNNTTQEQYGEAPEENKNEQQNNTTENEQNKNEQGETTPNQQEEQETERQEQTTNNNQTTQNEQTTTTTTGEVPNQEYVTEREETVKNPWETLEVGWGPTQFASIASTANLTAKKSNLEIHKTVDKESVKIGDTLTYTISVKNNGDKVAKAIIYDNVPEGTVLLNKDNNEDENTKKLTWRVTVEPGKTENVEFTVRVKAEKGTIKNSAIVNGKTTEETETGIINITGKKEVNTSEAKVGDTLTYTITLTNSGNATGTVTVTDEIPAGTTLVEESITNNGVESNGTITWTDVEVKAGDTVEVSFKVTINNDTKTSVRNTAVIDDNKPTEEVETKVANITGTKTVDKTEAKVGDTLTYTIKLTNSGNGDGKVTVTDEIPTGTRIKDENTTGYNKETNTMTWSNVEVKAGKSAKLALEVVVDDNISIIKNIAYVDGNKIPEEPETTVKHHYTVEHYTENLDGTYSKVDKDTVVSEDVEIGTKVSYEVKKYEGFEYDESQTVNKDATVPDNNNLVVKLYYTRNSYKVTYEYEGTVPAGASNLPEEATYKYGANVTVAEEATAPGYTFSGWDKEDFTMPAEDVVIKGSFTANTDTQYKVEHYLQDLDGNSYTLKDTETLAGTTDTTATATPKQYPGFTYDSTVEGTKTEGVITGDGQLVLKLYYTRNNYKVTYEYEGTPPSGASALPTEETYKYGASVTVAEDATAPGYKFSGWDHEDFTMPAEDVVIKGSFEARIDTKYRVEHYLENLNDEGFTLEEGKDYAATTDTKVTAEPKEYPGFTYDSTVEGTKTEGVITGDGQLVLKLYYTRNNYKVTYEYEGTPPSGASALPTEETYKYGASVTVAEDATAPGYKFSGWDHEDFTMPAEDVVIKGSFEARNDTKYRVEHYLENLNDEGFILEEGKDYAATTDTKVTAEPKEYPGFTFDSTVVGTKTEGIVTGDGQLVLKLYYVRATYTYTIHYFYNGVEDEGKQEGPFQAKFGEKVNSYRDKSEKGKYTQYDITSSNKTEEAILVIGTGENFINVYYGTPEVSINKDVSSKVANVGDTLDYTITVSENRKLVNARNIKVTDNLPSELDVIADSITSGGKLNDAKTEIEWNIAELEKGNNVELKFTARIKPNSIGKTISNTANLGGTTSGDSNTVTTTVSELKAAVKEVKKGTTGKDAVNIVLVMDLSYSMKSNKTSDGVTRLEAAKTAATKFINSIYTKDPKSKVTVTVLTFNSANPLTTIKYVGTERCTNNDILHLHWNCKNIDGVWYSKWEENTVEIPYSGTSKLGFADKSNYTSLVEEINEITLPNENPGPGLGTNVSAALDLTKTTVADLEENHSENSNVVILLSDGAPTTSYSGNSSWNNYEGLRNQASEIKGNPITTEFYSIQFGTEDGAYDLLRAMSSNNTVYTSNSINSLVENFTNILDQNTTKDPIDTVNGKYTTTLSNPLVVDADNLITVTYKGTTLFTCKSLPSNGLTYDSTTKTITWDINAWNAVEDHTKVTTNDIVIQCYVER
ncbi:MAG: InlB B-repeat-containing protein [Lachnospirales bacterium]